MSKPKIIDNRSANNIIKKKYSFIVNIIFLSKIIIIYLLRRGDTRYHIYNNFKYIESKSEIK